MVSLEVLFAFIGPLLFKSAISAPVNYEPIKITVNENFNAQPNQVSPALQALEPGFLHQGANFYIKPQLNLPQSLIPSHIQALISLLQQHHHSCAKDASKVVVEKDKLIEILKPFIYPSSDISKERLLENVLENENNLEIVKPLETNSPAIEEIVTEAVPVLAITTEKPKPVTSELFVIPEAPVLPPLLFNSIPSIVEEKVKNEESMIFVKPAGMFPEIPVRPIEEPIINYVEPIPIDTEFQVIPEAPVLPSVNDIKLVEGGVKIEDPIVVDIVPKPATPELLVIPEAPILSPLSFNGICSVVEEEVKKEDSVTLEETTGEFYTIPEIDVRPVQDPIFDYVETKTMTSELANNPEAAVLPSLSFNGIRPNVEKEIKKEESVIVEGQMGVFPTIPEIVVKPIMEPIINYIEPKTIFTEFQVVSKVLPPPLTNDIALVEEGMKIEEPIVVDVEPKPTIQELAAIPEAPILPPLSLHDVLSFVEEKVKKEESVRSPTGVFHTIPEIAVRPIQEPIIKYVEPKSATSELGIIPDAQVLPPLLFNSIPSLFEEEVEKEESIIFEEPTGVFPEIPVRPIDEPIINYVEPKPSIPEFQVIPEAPVLPPLSANEIKLVEERVKFEEPIAIDDESKPTMTEYQVIPEAPVLPPHSANDIQLLEQGVKIEEPINIDFESKPATPELLGIFEAPILPLLLFNGIPSVVKEEVKKEESVTLEETTGEFSTIPEIDVRPVQELILNYVEHKPKISELLNIPEAPVLPSLSFNDIPLNVEEEILKEESVIVEGKEGAFPTIQEIVVRPITESIINYVEPKPIFTEFQVIPEAPVLPSPSAKDFTLVEEGMKIDEPIVVNVEHKPVFQNLVLIPEAPGLPPSSDIPVSEDVKLEETITIEESIDGSSIPEISGRPIGPEPAFINVEPKSFTSNQIVIPEAPFLPAFKFNGIPPVDEEVKIEKSIKVEGSRGVFPSISEISARPIPESITVSDKKKSFALKNNIFPIGTEEVKIEIPILLEESIQVFPPTVEISSRQTLEPTQEHKMTNSYVLKEISQPNPERVVTVKETLPPTISKTSNNLGVFSNAPFVSHVSNRAPKTKKLRIGKPTLERLLLKKHPLRLPVTPFPKLPLNAMKSHKWGNKKQFLYPTSYAHYVVEKRIAPNMAFKNNAPPKRVKINIRTQVPKEPSY